jgi:hypothetical protein
MVVYGDNGSIDPAKFLEYIAKQFPLDLAQMVKAKDELAKRQGAISAVDRANNDRAKAAAELEAATAKASSILADAQAESLAVQAKKAEMEAAAAIADEKRQEEEAAQAVKAAAAASAVAKLEAIGLTAEEIAALRG